ncbi:hypothetical protein AB4090_13835 [Acidithiobacillus sp. IBUN Pt1247-S3]|uniref:hypothetical protein n=1 Tax=Acidithiobacillus sp. IBUN Pt1247-S3 TaxID=3166642 RepID=UPI0034E48EC5
MTAGIGSYRVVGKPERDLPEDSIFPLDTPEQKAFYFERLARFKAKFHGFPVYRLAPGEPQVKRFATPLRARRAKRGRVVPRSQRGVLHPPKRPRKLGVQARAVPHGWRRAIWETSAPTAPQRGRDGAPMTRAAGVYYLVGSARPIAQRRAKRLAEHADSPVEEANKDWEVCATRAARQRRTHD